MAERKAFLSPLTAMGWGLLLFACLIFVLTYIGLIPTTAYAAGLGPCKPISMVVSDALDQGGEVFLIEDPTEVARAAVFIIENEGTPLKGATSILYAAFMKTDSAEIAFAIGDRVCGYNSTNLETGQAFWDFVKFKAGRPA